MPSDKAAYLAAHYLTVDKPKTNNNPKKRKRKQATTSTSNSGGLLITEDDEPGWGQNPNNSDEEGDTPMTIAGTSAEFRRAKKSSWKTVGAPIPTDTRDARDAEAAAAADAILASAAAETAAARAADDDPDPEPTPAPLMADGTHAGLQRASAITAQLKLRQRAEREELDRMKAERGQDDNEQEELILRDATGRRVDISMRRAEARREAVQAEQAEEERKRALRGDVQLREAQERREALQEARLMPLARGKDDEEMNREMKAQARWNDPMAQFLEGRDDDGGKVGGGGKSGNKRRPVYKGAAMPNRYGIRPGYRWDGVDRGNGFEAERFKAINRRERNKGLSYSWQMDV